MLFTSRHTKHQLKNPNIMKTRILISSILMMVLIAATNAQQTTIPSVDLYTLDGEKINSINILDSGKPTVLILWKTYEKDCCNQICSILEAREKMLGKENVNIVCVCVDGLGNSSHIKPFVYGNDWEVDVYIDKNGDLKRAMSVVKTPLTILYDAEKSVICKYMGYCCGAGEMLCEKLKHEVVMK